MTQGEFVELHGEQAWKEIVEPMQDTGTPTQQSNANIICHTRIMQVLNFLNPAVSGLLEAQQLYS